MRGTEDWCNSGGDITGACTSHSFRCHFQHPLLQQKLEQFDILVPAYSGCPGNWPLKRMLLLCYETW